MGLITPTLPTSGEDRGTEEVDAINTLQSLVTVVNGNIDGANLAAAVFAPYKTLHATVGQLTSADGTTPKGYDADGTAVASGVAFANTPPMLIVPATNPWLLSGKTPKLRVTAHVACNNIAPGAGVLSVSLKAATFAGTAGNFTVTFGATIATAAVTPVQAAGASGVSADVDVPAAGAYILVANMSTALNANVIASINALVEMHHV